MAPLGNLVTIDIHSIEYCGDFSHPKAAAATIRRIKLCVIVNAAEHTTTQKD
jgi:dTDP-4-dehydrorhamnose reductase